jgi:hypothetical protein
MGFTVNDRTISRKERTLSFFGSETYWPDLVRAVNGTLNELADKGYDISYDDFLTVESVEGSTTVISWKINEELED